MSSELFSDTTRLSSSYMAIRIRTVAVQIAIRHCAKDVRSDGKVLYQYAPNWNKKGTSWESVVLLESAAMPMSIR